MLLGETPPEPHALSGKLYDLIANPYETINIFASKPEVIGDLLQRYRASMARRFMRYQAARSSEQPRSAFAIAAKYMTTEVSLPKAGDQIAPQGWSRFNLKGDNIIVGYKTDEPLSVHFPLPNGIYNLSLKMQGHALVEVGNQRRVVTGPIVEFGEINVTDEIFRATIRSRGTDVAISFFGFNPATAGREDPEAAEDRLQRLRSLGYVGD